MAKLKIKITRNLTEVVSIQDSMVLGRAKDCDVVLLRGAISRHHAKIYVEDSHFLLEDLDSANGTYVNGNKISLHVLQEGDEISIGDTRLFFSSETWEDPILFIDLMSKSFEDYDVEKILQSKDVLLKFPTKDDYIYKVHDIVQQKIEALPLPSELEKTNLYTGIHESINNAQRHGHNYQEDLPIEVRYTQKNNCLTVRVTDQGEGFDYRSELQKKKETSGLKAARERYLGGGYGGLGMMLMLGCVDQVEYNSKGNQVTLIKNLPQAC